MVSLPFRVVHVITRRRIETIRWRHAEILLVEGQRFHQCAKRCELLTEEGSGQRKGVRSEMTKIPDGVATAVPNRLSRWAREVAYAACGWAFVFAAAPLLLAAGRHAVSPGSLDRSAQIAEWARGPRVQHPWGVRSTRPAHPERRNHRLSGKEREGSTIFPRWNPYSIFRIAQ